MANSFGTSTLSKALRDKYRQAQIDLALRKALVAEKVCLVDRSDLKTISNPYLTALTATVATIAGTYTTGDNLTTTDEYLEVTDQVTCPTHIYQFEQVTSNFDLFYTATKAMTNAMVEAIDKWVVNELCERGTTEFDTPAGGFTTSANVVTILATIIAKCSGYAEAMNGFYVIVENSDLTGIIPAQAGSGYSYADAALNNGFVVSMLGVDIYVVRDSTFVDATASTASGSKTWTNSGHRVGGVKKVATYASPRGVVIEEKGITNKTGQEVVAIANIGFKQWYTTAALTCDITIK